MSQMDVEQFPALSALAVPHGFTWRVAGLDVTTDRALALERLEGYHRQAQAELGLGEFPLLTAEQVHGKEVALVRRDEPIPPLPFPGCDGIVTNRDDACLGIYVADCCAVYLVDPVQGAIGLVHAGKKGAELGIVPVAIDLMVEAFGTRPSDLVVQLSSCIRPPWYEVEFSKWVIEQCHAAGVRQIHDCGTCTAGNPEQYYSYRREKGRTGRMLALLALPRAVR
jgi:copper oxidase (laccase) domain-containing protein